MAYCYYTVLLLVFLACHTACLILVPWSGIKPRSWEWNCQVSTTGLPGTSHILCILKVWNNFSNICPGVHQPRLIFPVNYILFSKIKIQIFWGKMLLNYKFKHNFCFFSFFFFFSHWKGYGAWENLEPFWLSIHPSHSATL